MELAKAWLAIREGCVSPLASALRRARMVTETEVEVVAGEAAIR